MNIKFLNYCLIYNSKEFNEKNDDFGIKINDKWDYLKIAELNLSICCSEGRPEALKSIDHLHRILNRRSTAAERWQNRKLRRNIIMELPESNQNIKRRM